MMFDSRRRTRLRGAPQRTALRLPGHDGRLDATPRIHRSDTLNVNGGTIKIGRHSDLHFLGLKMTHRVWTHGGIEVDIHIRQVSGPRRSVDALLQCLSQGGRQCALDQDESVLYLYWTLSPGRSENAIASPRLRSLGERSDRGERSVLYDVLIVRR